MTTNSSTSFEREKLRDDDNIGDTSNSSNSGHDDSATLARMGKKQILKRKFGFVSILSFSCTILDTWEGVLCLLEMGLLNGGTVGLIGQYLLVWAGTLSTFVAIGELASMAPTASGQYHWVAMLAPRRYRNLLSYLTGWMTCLAWISTVATGAYLAGSMITAIIQVDDPTYVQTYRPYQLTLIAWTALAIAILVNTVIGHILPQVEGTILIVHILGFFAILIPLVYYAPRESSSQVFGDPIGHLNGGNWPTYGLSFMVGISGSAFSFVGADAAVHMSEEIANATINVPRSIFGSIMLNGALGFGMLIAVIYCMGNPQAALNAEETIGYPFIEILLAATNSKGGTTAMTVILIVMAYGATVGFLATSSRMVWSFARDRGLPFATFLTKVTSKAKLPITAIMVASVIPALLLLINIGSTAVFNDVTSLSIVGFYSTYFISCALLLYHRLRGTIQHTSPGTNPSPAYKDEKTGEYILTWGRWHFKGVLGTINNLFACCYLVTVGFFALFPSTTPTSASGMNYACVVFGFVVLYSLFYYLVWGRRQYSGPIVEIII